MLFKVCLNTEPENFRYVEINSLEDLDRFYFSVLKVLKRKCLFKSFNCRLVVDFTKFTISICVTKNE